MDSRSKTVCFTGHRHLSYQDLKLIDATLYPQIENLYMEGYTHFIAGGAFGFDTLAAEAVLKLRAVYPDVTLTIAIPCPGQSKSWSDKAQKKYRDILNAADNSVVICDHYTSYCMHARNRYMVDNSSLLVAFYKNVSGGSKNTYDYALKKLPYIINLAEPESIIY